MQQVQLVVASDFLRSDVAGQIDFDLSKQLLRDLGRACARHPGHHMLVDVRETRGFLSAEEIYCLVEVLEEVGLGEDCKLAILNRPKDDFDRAKLLEMCAKKRGLRVAAFRDFEAAFEWIRQ
ncbi:MAG: hypothetical protein AB7O62_19105 [Pirellulales bacterium]